MYGYTRLPDPSANQAFSNARWSEGPFGLSTFGAGSMAQAPYAHGNSAQEFAASARPAIPQGVPPPMGNIGASFPTDNVDMVALPYYAPEYAETFQANDTLPGDAMVQLQEFETPSGPQNPATDASFYCGGSWQA